MRDRLPSRSQSWPGRLILECECGYTSATYATLSWHAGLKSAFSSQRSAVLKRSCKCVYKYIRGRFTADNHTRPVTVQYPTSFTAGHMTLRRVPIGPTCYLHSCDYRLTTVYQFLKNSSPSSSFTLHWSFDTVSSSSGLFGRTGEQRYRTYQNINHNYPEI